MPTLHEWDSALRVPRKVSIESSPALLAEVQAKQVQHDARLQATLRIRLAGNQTRPPRIAKELGDSLLTQVSVPHDRIAIRLSRN